MLMCRNQTQQVMTFVSIIVDAVNRAMKIEEQFFEADFMQSNYLQNKLYAQIMRRIEL